MLDKWTVTIPELTGDEERFAYVYVPDNYEEGTLFPVLYMFDGQNLFYDEEASFGKSWGMLDFFETNDIPVIIAAVECNHHSEKDPCGGRLSEYSPFDFVDRHWKDIMGRGKITMDWFVNEFKPYVDDNYPTLPQREYTLIAGSSMGGLMTLYAVSAYNEFFSRAAALSPSIHFGGEPLHKLLSGTPLRDPTRIYMDVGTGEIPNDAYGLAAELFEYAAKLTRNGAQTAARIVPGAVHNEAAWEKRIPVFMDYLLKE